MNIAVVRYSAIGDIVFATAILPYLNALYPNASITWFVREDLVQTLSGYPDITVVALPKFSLSNLSRIRSMVQARAFDLALDLQGLLKTSVILSMMRADRKIGLGSKEGGQWLVPERVPRTGDPTRFAHEYHSLGQYLAKQEDELMMPTYRYSSDTIVTRDAFLQQEGLVGGYIALCPHTTRPQKHWIPDYWQELVALIYHELDLPCLVIGARGDVPPCAHPTLVNACGKGPIDFSFSLLSGARAVISVDTGLGHFANAQQLPVVLLFGSTMPYRTSKNPRARVITKQVPCAPCRRTPTCDGIFHCMRMIEPEEVLTTLKQVTADNVVTHD